MAAEKEPEPLTATARAERVLISQGYAPMRLPSFPEDVRASLAALCDESGAVQRDAREQVRGLLGEYFAAQKAAVAEADSESLPTDPPLQ